MQTERQGQLGRIIPSERIDLTTAGEFKNALEKLYGLGCNYIEVDCRNLTMIDSAGLGSLVLFQKKLRDRRGRLKLTNVKHKYILHLLDMLELDRVIEIK